MASDVYVTVEEVCRVMSAGVIAYAMSTGEDCEETLTRWAEHMVILARGVDDPAVADAMCCMATLITESAPRVRRRA